MCTYIANLGPEVIAARLLLEAEGKIHRLVLSPHNQRLLLLLVDSVWQNLGL